MMHQAPSRIVGATKLSTSAVPSGMASRRAKSRPRLRRGGFSTITSDSPFAALARVFRANLYSAARITLMSVRRFSCRPASVVFSATGLADPRPIVWNLAVGTFGKFSTM